jgi:hypothetical protein
MDKNEALKKIPDLLRELASLDVSEVRTEEPACDLRYSPDLTIIADSLTFFVEYKGRSNAEAIGSALLQIEAWKELTRDDSTLALLVVPYMGEVGRRLCGGAGVGWMDLSGNALIRAPGLHVNVRGLPNRYATRGRPQNVFAPKASRIVRMLLLQPNWGWLHQELVDETQLTKGYVSKLVTRLEQAGFVEKREGRRYWLRNAEALLTAWRASYDFSDHRIIQGYVAERTPEAVLRHVVDGFGNASVKTAITGLAAAWHYNHHAAFRLCALYASPMLGADQLEDLGFREVESGANTWLIEPADEGVFMGEVVSDGLTYVNSLQVYLDLKDHPERSSEAAEYVRPLLLQGDVKDG